MDNYKLWLDYFRKKKKLENCSLTHSLKISSLFTKVKAQILYNVTKKPILAVWLYQGNFSPIVIDVWSLGKLSVATNLKMMARMVAQHTERYQHEIRKLVRHSDQCISLEVTMWDSSTMKWEPLFFKPKIKNTKHRNFKFVFWLTLAAMGNCLLAFRSAMRVDSRK